MSGAPDRGFPEQGLERPRGPVDDPTAHTLPPAHLPRELVLASAGTGKTFRVSSRIIGLLELGAEVDQVLASTFTRKAAGEILDRVLERLARAALDPDRAKELASHALLREDGSHTGVRDWQELLSRLAQRLHRMNVGTLDAFFVRAARSFELELGLPSAWSIEDGPTSDRLESEALEDVLEGADRAETLELVRALVGGDATRSVHARVLEQARDLRRLLHQIDSRAEEPWNPLGETGRPPPTDRERTDAVDRLEALTPPANKDGSPDRNWVKALAGACEDLGNGDWDALLEKGIGRKVLDGESVYQRKPISPDVAAVYEEVLDLCRRSIRADYARRGRALGALADRFDRALEGRQRREGAYRFDDLTRRVGGVDPLGARPDFWYRLDQRARHLLLDEFQDTSLTQWEALRPLAEELLSGHAEERAAVVVADPKQSIYGWRGAEPELVHRVGRRYPLREDRLRLSYRSSQRVLDFVNRVFEGLDGRSIWEGDEEERDRALVRSWLGDFDPHEAARELPGRVRVEVGPREDEMGRGDRPLMMRRAAGRVAEIRARAPGHTVGVLLRKNRNIPLLMTELRSRGIEASEEGGTRLTDSPAVAAFLSLLRLADHPGDTIAAYHVSRSPLGPLVGLAPEDGGAASGRIVEGPADLSLRLRRAFLQDGYGPTLDGWTCELARKRAVGSRDLRRLFQLVELGFRWDERGATLRPADFVRFAESEKVEDPAAARVRVMTVHQAKGLEFDVVVLPELDAPLTGDGGGAPSALPERDPETGHVLRVFPYVKKSARALVPEVEAAAGQHRAAELRDALGVLYVAMTRARYALHLLVAADGPGGPSRSQSFSRLVREAVDRHDTLLSDREVLLDDGTGDWPARIPEERREETPAEAPPPVVRRIRLTGPAGRRRLLAHRTPTGMDEEEDTVEEALSLAGDSRERSRRAGTVAHEWLRLLEWVSGDEAGLPGDEELLQRARTVAPEVEEEEMRELLHRFRGWLEAPAVREVLSRSDEESVLRVERERSFAVRLGEEIVEGVVDRLVLIPGEDGRIVGARILDFKTDRKEPDRLERYRRQVEAYREAVRHMYGLGPGRVEALLVFLREGSVVRV